MVVSLILGDTTLNLVAKGILQIAASIGITLFIVMLVFQCQEPYVLSENIATGKAAIDSMPKVMLNSPATTKHISNGVINTYTEGLKATVRVYKNYDELVQRLIKTTITHYSDSADETNTRLRSDEVTDKRIFSSSLGNIGEYSTYDGYKAIFFTNKNTLFILEASNKDALEMAIDEFPYIRHLREDEKTTVTKIVEISPPLFILFMLILFVLLSAFLVAGIFSLGEAAMLVKPEKNISPISKESLAKKLLELNKRDVPFVVRDGGKNSDLIIDWKLADAKWFNITEINSLKKVFRTRIVLNEKTKEAGVTDRETGIRITASAGKNNVKYTFTLSFFIGIVSEVSVGYALGYNNLESLKPQEIYKYHFNTGIIKNPLKEIITGAGWTYSPKVFSPRVDTPLRKEIFNEN